MFGHDVKKEKRNSMTVGLIVGAAAGAVGVLMTDKNNRKKVSDKVEQVRQWSTKTSQDMKNKASDLQSSTEDKTKELKAKVDKRANSVKEDIENEKEATKRDARSLK